MPLATAANPWPMFILCVFFGISFLFGLAVYGFARRFKKQPDVLRKGMIGLFAFCFLVIALLFSTAIERTTQVMIGSAECNIPGADFGSSVWPGHVNVTEVGTNETMRLRFPIADLDGVHMDVYAADGQQLNDWFAYTFCDPDMPFSATFDTSKSVWVTYNLYGRIQSWQLTE